MWQRTHNQQLGLCSNICDSFHPLAQKYSQNNDKNIHQQGEKVIPNVVCRDMCQRHQNWFAEYLLARKRRRTYVRRLVRTVSWHSETFQIIVTQRCMFTLLLLKFSAYTLKCYHPVKTSSWKKKSVYSLRGITHFGAKIYEYRSRREFQRSCKGYV